MKWMKRSALILILLLLAIYPFVGDPYFTHLIILSLIWAVVASAWNLIMGYAGIHSFAQLAFFAIGAYASSMLEILAGVNPWVALPLGGLLTALTGLIIAFPCLRLKGLYIVLVTVAFHQVIPVFIKLAGDWTGGDVGLVGMPHYIFFGFNFGRSKLGYYYLAFFLFLVMQYAMYRIIHSKIGLAFVALRDAEPFAESLGVNRTKFNIVVFVISSFITGTMGTLYVHYLKVATPRLLELESFSESIMMVVVGGLGQFPGVIVGAFLVTFVNEFLRTAGLIRPIIFGGIIILVIILLPEGLSGLIRSFNDWIEKLFGPSPVREDK
jgi:branched-chain amino acid transport system permease protein